MKSAVSAASSSIVLKKFMRPSDPCGGRGPPPYDRAPRPEGNICHRTRAKKRRAAPRPPPGRSPRPRPAAPPPQPLDLPPRGRRPRRPRAGALRRLGAPRHRGRLLTAARGRGEAGHLHQLGAEVRGAVCQPALCGGGAQHLTPPFCFTCFTDDADGLPRRDPGRAAAGARRRDADRHQGDLAEGAALERRARRPQGAGPVHGPRPRGGRRARRLLQLRRPRRGHPRPQPDDAARAARPDLDLPLPGRQAAALAGEIPRRPAGRRRRLPVRAALRHPRGAGRASRSGPSHGCGTSASIARGCCRSTSSCRRGSRRTRAWSSSPAGSCRRTPSPGTGALPYRPMSPGEHLRGLFAADRPDPPLRYLRHYLRPAPWVAEAWRE